jgi:hypothetical protein
MDGPLHESCELLSSQPCMQQLMNYDDVSKFNIKCVSHVTIFITRITSDLSRNGEMTGQLYSLAVAAQLRYLFRLGRTIHTRHLLLRVCVCVFVWKDSSLSWRKRDWAKENLLRNADIKRGILRCTAIMSFSAALLARTSVRAGINSDNCNRLNSALCTLK